MRLRERWSVLQQGGEHDGAQGSPSDATSSLLRLKLSPFNSRHIEDHFSIIFRVQIEQVDGQWVPWTKPAPAIKRETTIESRSRSPEREVKHEAGGSQVRKRSRSPLIKREPQARLILCPLLL